jgi:hypothetical protein
MAAEVIAQQLADPRRLLIGGVVADTRQGREKVIRLDEFGRAFRSYAADRVIGLAPDEQGRHAGGADRRALAARDTKRVLLPWPVDCQSPTSVFR